MKVTMRTIYAGPHGTCDAGKHIDLPDDHAKGLIKAGHAHKHEDTAMRGGEESASLNPSGAAKPPAAGAGAAPRRKNGQPPPAAGAGAAGDDAGKTDAKEGE